MPTDDLTVYQTILGHRGIPLFRQSSWLAPTDSDIADPELFGDCITLAARRILQAVEAQEKVMILQDCDADGVFSAAIAYNLLYNLGVKNIDYIIHAGKAHGLADIDLDRVIESGYTLFIVPDAGSNDYEQHKYLKDNGVDVIIADHHLADKISEDTIVVNNQLSDYPDKNLSGAGVMWQLARLTMRLSDRTFDPYDMIDLCALGNLSDMMDYRNQEIRAIVKKGLSPQYFKAPFLQELAKKNNYSMEKMGGINYHSCAFYITPFINAVCRSGTLDEKDLLLRSLLRPFQFERVPSSKRGEKGMEVPCYVEAVTMVQRVKRRQTDFQDSSMKVLEDEIKDNNLAENAVIVLVNDPGVCEQNLQGLVANKIQSKYQRATLVLTRRFDSELDTDVCAGSLRNYSQSLVDNFKQVCDNTGYPLFTAGHENACGIALKEEDIPAFIEAVNEQYEGIDLTPCYWVDYIWDASRNEIDGDTILEIANMDEIWGQDMPESLVAITNIELSESNVVLLSPDKHPTIKISCNGVELIKFGSSEEEYEKLISGEEGNCIRVVGTPAKNEWMGNITPQIKIQEYELYDYWRF